MPEEIKLIDFRKGKIQLVKDSKNDLKFDPAFDRFKPVKNNAPFTPKSKDKVYIIVNRNGEIGPVEKWVGWLCQPTHMIFFRLFCKLYFQFSTVPN